MFFFSNSFPIHQNPIIPTEFITAFESIDIAEDNRIVFTEARAEKGNKLFREIARAANIGKDTFLASAKQTTMIM